jgi:hypothetical protein
MIHYIFLPVQTTHIKDLNELQQNKEASSHDNGIVLMA